MLSFHEISTLYVAPGGVGNGRCAKECGDGFGPLGSLADAFMIIKQMRGGGMLQPVTVKMMAGEYVMKKTLTVDPMMSNVCVEPYGDGEVLISGGRRITGFEKTVWKGMPCFGAFIPEVKDGKWKFTDLYVDGLRADFTRFPEEGAFYVKEAQNIGPNQQYPSKWFVADPADMDRLKQVESIEDCIISFNHWWIDEHTPVQSLDTETGKVTMEYWSRFTIKPGQDYILENVPTLKHPNEWYLDRKSGMLYYVPRNEEQTPESIEVWAPVVSKIIEVKGQAGNPVTGVRFRGLKFAYTRGDYGSRENEQGFADGVLFASDPQAVGNADGSISVKYAHSVAFENCTMSNFGVHGFNVMEGCHNVKLEGCTIKDGGAGGIRVCGGAFGAPEADMTWGNTIADCTILGVGKRYLSACGILLMHTYENDVLHNEVGDLYYTGISCGWTWGYGKSVCRNNRIMYNHIYDLGKGKLSDMGGVYLLGNQPGTVVANNRIHDIKCKEYGGWAIYTDEGSVGITIENNLCYRTSSNCYHQHYGSSNVVRNNIFADSDRGVLRVSRPETHLSIIFTNNIVYSKGTAMFVNYAQKAPGAHSLEDGAISSNRNLFWCHNGEFRYSEIWFHEGDEPEKGQKIIQTLEDAKKLGMEFESVAADPMFVDPENGDYTLRPESPAFAMGFRAFDVKKCGPRKTI
ncbi:MAG: right-handed parallel beta-helix repeat-containing protein [Lachnospiraceae bacterium]|nr:right-handed parallel beta-helix repeat-containing protein [Lachnospiraceae bacterium]